MQSENEKIVPPPISKSSRNNLQSAISHAS